VGFVTGIRSKVQSSDIKEESHSIKSFLHKSLNIAGLALMAGSTIFSSCSIYKTYANPKTSVDNNQNLVMTDNNQHTYNPMTVAGNFLKLADTCAAWDIINSLDTMTIHTNVQVFDIRPLKGIDNLPSRLRDIILQNEKPTIDEFSKLCELAVNYTIREYSKVSPYPITILPQNLFVTLYSEEDNLFASFTPYNNKMRVNEYYFKFKLDANVFAFFTTIDHETIHLMYQLNNPLQKQVDDTSVRFDTLLKYGIRLNRAEVELYLKLYEKCEKETEIEAYKFESSVFKKLFKGILEDTGQFIDFDNKYLKSGLEDSINKEGNQYRVNTKAFENIRSNIESVRVTFPVLNEQLEEINSGVYNNISLRCRWQKEKYLKDDTP